MSTPFADILSKFETWGIVPVIRLDREEDALPLAAALLEAGLPCAEITFRTAAAEGAIRTLIAHHPEMLVGAGTILSRDQAQRAAACGAQFVVSPGFSPPVVEWCLEQGLMVMPGVATPSEIMAALERGLQAVKFFPAELLGGVRMLKALGDVFPGMRFLPTGGVSESNLAEYLKLPNVIACGGTWLVSSQLILRKQFAEITRLAQRAVAIADGTRSRDN